MQIKNFEQFIEVAEESKRAYHSFSCSFLYRKARIQWMRDWKNLIYSIPCNKANEYKHNICWLYFNNDITYEEMIEVLNRK